MHWIPEVYYKYRKYIFSVAKGRSSERNDGKGRKVAILCVETYFWYPVHYRNLVHLPCMKDNLN